MTHSQVAAFARKPGGRYSIYFWMELWEIIGFTVAVIAMGTACSTFFVSRPTTEPIKKFSGTTATFGENSNTIADRACFGAGCYWGTEKYIRHDLSKRNKTGTIERGAVGFMGPASAFL